MNTGKKESTKNEFIDFLETPVQEFEAPEFLESEEESDPFNFDMASEGKKASTSEREKNSLSMADRYVKMFDKAFSNLAAVYSSGDASDYQIDSNDQKDLADPLAELIAENDFLDLPPGWALIVTAFIIYGPLAMKAVGERKDAKALKEFEGLTVKKAKSTDVEEKTDSDTSTDNTKSN